MLKKLNGIVYDKTNDPVAICPQSHSSCCTVGSLIQNNIKKNFMLVKQIIYKPLERGAGCGLVDKATPISGACFPVIKLNWCSTELGVQ